MTLTILDQDVSRAFIARRRADGLDRWDEVWEGDYIAMTQPDNEHQEIVAGMTALLFDVIQRPRHGKVFPGVNVSDRRIGWQENYRCPDVVVFLNENPAENHNTFWYGGPDFAVEVVSPGDRTREKLGFYAAVGTRELLVVDRKPWRLELYQLHQGELQLAGSSTPADPQRLLSRVIPLCFALTAGADRPAIQVQHQHASQEWTF